MHQIVSATVDSSRRWWVLAIVVAAQFMFGVDAFIVNVAIPTIAVELHASSAQIEAVIAIYLIAYATLVVTGGRLGDIYGTKNVFLAGVLGFTLTSLWCGLAQSGPELIVARLAQGATAALMVPQVLATLHLLFSDASRGRAFGIYGIVLGLAGAAGFLLGGVLVTSDLAGLGWRAVFFVNVPFGLIIIAAAWRIMPSVPRRAGTRLDVPGAIVLFAGLLCLIGPLLFGHDRALGAVDLAGDGGRRCHHRRLPAARARCRKPWRHAADRSCAVVGRRVHARSVRGLLFLFREPVILSGHDHVHAEGAAYSAAAGRHGVRAAGADLRDRLAAQRRAGAASRHAGADRGLRDSDGRPCDAGADGGIGRGAGALLLALVLAIFGYGQGLVMAPLSSAVLSTVKPASAGSGAGMYGTTAQIANAAGVAAIGAVFFAVEAAAFGAAGAVRRVGVVCAVDCRLRRISVMDAPRAHARRNRIKSARSRQIPRELTVHGLFILQCSNYLFSVELRILSPRSCRCLSPKMSNSCDACQS